MHDQNTEFITPKDAAILEKLLGQGVHDEWTRNAILRKIDSAQLRFGGDISNDVATVGSRLIFQLSDREPQERVLTWSVDPYPTGTALHVASPIGIALLGRSPGACVSVRQGGRLEQLTLVAVLFQPEANVRRSGIPSSLAAHLRIRSEKAKVLPFVRPVRAPYWDESDDPGPAAA